MGNDSMTDGARVANEHSRAGTQRLGSNAQRGRAKYQIAVVVCEACRRGWQEGGGKRIPIAPADVERAQCDAQRVGSLDGEPESAVQDIPPKTRRFVWRRDGDRCTVPGCRASSFIEVHHIVHREDGGGHEAENLTLLCGGHHDAHHAGRLVIRGRAPNLTFEIGGDRWKPTHAHVDDRLKPAGAHVDDRLAQMRADAVLALHTLGFKKPEAIAAVDAALAAASPPFDLEVLLRLALRHCPK
jgi:5-methylcytosine-specific restriction endonuclease McrA